MKKKVVILGGGISGLTAAYLFAKSDKYEVHIVEKNDQLGGLLRSFDYGEFGRFDYGAHNILETGIAELDEFYLNLFPKDEWQATTTVNGQIRALTGLMYNKKLQEQSPFIDLRENDNLESYIGDFFKNLNNNTDDFANLHDKDAYSYSLYLFGEKITDEIIVPAILKLYKTHPKELNTMVLFLTQFTRIGLFEEDIMKELITTNKIGSRLSYTEQLNLPKENLTNLRSLYPKKFGIYRVVDAIEKKLLDMNVTFHMSASINQITTKDSVVTSVLINDKPLDIDRLVCSVGYPAMTKLLNIDIQNYKFDKNPKTAITNLLIDKPLNCGELSFIYSYDTGTKIFRIDNYINYCDGAKRKGLYPVSIETLHFESPNVNELQKKVIDELIEYNIMEKNVKVELIKTEILEYGFPLLTQNNISIMNDIRNKVNDLEIKNLTNIGVLSEKGLFFESHIIHDTYAKIKELV